MTRFTEKTIRTNGRWVKITRDNKDRTFTFAVGRDGNFFAHHVDTLTFKWVANWDEAKSRAESLTTYY